MYNLVYYSINKDRLQKIKLCTNTFLGTQHSGLLWANQVYIIRTHYTTHRFYVIISKICFFANIFSYNIYSIILYEKIKFVTFNFHSCWIERNVYKLMIYYSISNHTCLYVCDHINIVLIEFFVCLSVTSQQCP